MKKIFTLMMLSLMTTVCAMAADTYVIAGVTAICGSSWNGSDANNKMTTTDGVTYTLVKEGCTLEAGTAYEFKVVKNGSTWIPDGMGNNSKVTVTENGIYTVTFTYKTTESAASATAVKTGDAEIGEKTWTVAGSSIEIFGAAWAEGLKDNDMTKQSDGTYKLEKKSVSAHAGTVTYKVVANHSWDESYGKDGGGDAELSIPEDGTYDVVFTFSTTTKIPSATATKTGSDVGEVTWTVAGSFVRSGSADDDVELSTLLFGTKWDPTVEANDMAKQSDGTFKLVKTGMTLPVGQIQFKVCAQHDWGTSYGDGDGNYILPIDAEGEYDITFTFNADTKTVGSSAEKKESDGITTVRTSRTDTPAYNLAGQRVNGNAKRQVVIQNGKKVVVK